MGNATATPRQCDGDLQSRPIPPEQMRCCMHRTRPQVGGAFECNILCTSLPMLKKRIYAMCKSAGKTTDRARHRVRHRSARQEACLQREQFITDHRRVRRADFTFFLGNYTYFGSTDAVVAWRTGAPVVILCALAGGAAGGLFSRTMIAVASGMPAALGAFIRRWRLVFAALCGVLVAAIRSSPIRHRRRTRTDIETVPRHPHRNGWS